jgi:hypothetical protein
MGGYQQQQCMGQQQHGGPPPGEHITCVPMDSSCLQDVLACNQRTVYVEMHGQGALVHGMQLSLLLLTELRACYVVCCVA